MNEADTVLNTPNGEIQKWSDHNLLAVMMNWKVYKLRKRAMAFLLEPLNKPDAKYSA